MKELALSTVGKTLSGFQVMFILVLESTTRDGWTSTPWAFRMGTVYKREQHANIDIQMDNWM